MGGGQADAEHRGSSRHRRRPDCGNEKSRLNELPGKGEDFIRRLKIDWYDRSRIVASCESEGAQTLAQEPALGTQPFTLGVHPTREFDRLCRRSQDCRWRCGGIDPRAGVLGEPIDQDRGAGDKPPGATESFAEGAGSDPTHGIDLGSASDASSMLAEHAAGMRFIGDRHRVVLLAKILELKNRSHIAIHTEDRIGDHPGASMRVSDLLEQLFQLIQIRVGIDVDRRSRQSAAVDQACVVKRIAEDHIFLVGEGGDSSDVGRVAAGEDHRSLRLFPTG